MDGAPDVQNFQAPRQIPLSRVGVRSVRKPVRIQRPDREDVRHAVAEFNLFVDLPAQLKGTHMSRNVEALADVLDEEIGSETRSLENMCRRIVQRLLEKHDYAAKAFVEAKTDMFLTQKNPGGKDTIERYELHAAATGDRDGPIARQVGVRVVGMSACPCAMETARFKFAAEGKMPNPDIPFITHNQRNVVTLELGLQEGEDVEAAQLVAIAEASLSAPTFELLKRGDEGDLVIRAHENPKFVEDVVRDALHFTVEAFPELPDDAYLFISSDAEESIHKHNAYAECTTSFGAIRNA